MSDRSIYEYKRLLLYGIGNQFKECYKLFQDKELELFDSNQHKWGQTIDAHIIHSPRDMLQYIDEETCIVISSIYNQYEIAKTLADTIKAASDIIYMYTSQWYETNIYKEDTVAENWDKIISLSERFADRESREYYLNAIAARRQRNPLLLIPNPRCVQAGEYAGRVCLNKGDSIIDCGAYIGDTAEMYMNRLENDCIVYAVEPYKENYDKLEQKIEQMNWRDNVRAFHCAVGDKVDTAMITYDQDDFGMAISLSNRSGIEHQTVNIETLDHLFDGQHISYIKMDIEGEEVKALKGAQKMIRSDCPRLMISGYHKIEDFWEIPETIWSINGNYKIFVGHAPGVSTELEFYCIDD